MPREVERKFLASKDFMYANVKGYSRIIQGYILTENKENSVRVRLVDDCKAFLTIKGANKSSQPAIDRLEFEYEIPVEDGKKMIEELKLPIVEKVRYKVQVDKDMWEVDDFRGRNVGLLIAEIELKEPEQIIAFPAWAGLEITHDTRYACSTLAVFPYETW